MSDRIEGFTHSVMLQEDKCKGCTNCIKRCPTEAIRVHKGKATIINERCIDCGECIRACPHGAKHAVTDSMDMLKKFKYCVAIPAPALYSQYRSARSRNHILTALKKLGFDDVFEVALGAEVVSNATRQFLRETDIPGPVISTACPAVVRLIQVRFPNLIDRMLPLAAPVEVAAEMARNRALKNTKLRPEAIGIFFISPCAAKMHSKYWPSRGSVSNIDAIISFQDIYMKLRESIKSLPEEAEEEYAEATVFGVRWANPGGESLALNINKFLAVDGINEVVKILETVENSDKFEDVDFLEALACTGGCLGGALTVKNPFFAQIIMKSMRSEAKGKFQVADLPLQEIDYKDILWDKQLEHVPIHQLDSDIMRAMEKLENMEQITDELPGLDCGACGAPNCRAFAEDVVRGEAMLTDCIFKLRERVRDLAVEMYELENMHPPTLEHGNEKSENKK